MSYLKVHYSENARPLTSYPNKLCGFLAERFDIAPGMRILDFGCGRGEMTQGFRNLKIDVTPADTSPDAGTCLETRDVVLLGSGSPSLPFSDNEFDVVFSKSVVEHLHDPVSTFSDLMRVLKPGGMFVTLTPDWERNYKTFFDDVTHVRPFTQKSLAQMYGLLGLEKIEIFRFRQLPSCWKYRSINLLAALVGTFAHHRASMKFLRWSRELMIAGAGRKPSHTD